MMEVVVVIHGDERQRTSLVRQLELADYVVESAGNGMEALGKVYALRPNAIVLDMDLSEMDGQELTRLLRAVSEDVAIIVLGKAGDPARAVRILDMGADDYVEKPFVANELVARMRAAIRRAARNQQPRETALVIQTGDLMLDRESRVARKNGIEVPLTPTEYRLLEALAVRAGKVVPHRLLLSAVWGDEFVDDTHYLRIYIGYLRRKVEDDPARPKYLVNEWGTGYRLAVLPVVEPELERQRLAG